MQATDETLWAWWMGSVRPYGAYLEDHVPAEHLPEFVRLVSENVELSSEAFDLANDLFGGLPDYSAQAMEQIRAAGPHFFAEAISRLLPELTDFKAYAKSVGDVVGVRGRELYMPLRAALTGKTHGPEMARLFPLIGTDRARKRLEAAVRIAGD